MGLAERAVAAVLLLLAAVSVGRRQTVEEVTKKQLEAYVAEEDYLAVYWYTKNCKTCDRVQSILETRQTDLADAGIRVVKLADRKTAKQNGVLTFPGLTFFKAGKGHNFEGDLSSSEAVTEFLASDEALDLPDRIEEVNAKRLDVQINEKTFIAVLFHDAQPESTLAIAELEKIDRKADKLGISFVKIADLELVDEYGLTGIPSLVYYRHQAPIVFEGDLKNEEDVLQWLVKNRSTGEESEDVIEAVSASSLETMIESVENLAVLFYDSESRKADLYLESLEKIDDDCDVAGINFVKVDDAKTAAKEYGLEELPRLVLFKNKLPNVFEGNLLDDEVALDWLTTQATSESVEEVTPIVLSKLVGDARRLAVLFCKYIGYVVIAVSHTCYLLRHYCPPGSRAMLEKNFLPADRVKGMAMES